MVISAAIAMKGTWKKEYAVAPAMKVTRTQATARPCGVVGPAKIAAKATARASPPQSTKGRRLPFGEVERSLIRPAMGFMKKSHALGRKTIRPAIPAARPRRSVRYGRSSRPGTVPKVPDDSPPMA